MARRNRNKNSGNGFAPIERPEGKDRRFLKLSLFVLDSPEYKRLSHQAKHVMNIMQKQHWTNKYTTIGRKQIASEMGCDVKTVSRIWKELMASNWLRIDKFHDHHKSEPRTWELLWLSYFGKPPKDTWLKK